jgi:hypothetical protein
LKRRSPRPAPQKSTEIVDREAWEDLTFCFSYSNSSGRGRGRRRGGVGIPGAGCLYRCATAKWRREWGGTVRDPVVAGEECGRISNGG